MRREALLLIPVLAACDPASLPDDLDYQPALVYPDCRPDNDGEITAAELPFVADVTARYRVAEGPVTVDVTGVLDSTGTRVWDFSLPEPSEEPLAAVAVAELDDQWFASFFPGAELVGPLAADGDLLGLLTTTDNQVRLLGSASAEAAPAEGQTLLVYDDPITLYDFPLRLGDLVASSSMASDVMLVGIPTALQDDYEVEVTARGTVILPDLILDNTLRVTLRLERRLLVGDARQTVQIFVHECLGEVVRVTSPAVPLATPLADDFTTAQQIWRLSL